MSFSKVIHAQISSDGGEAGARVRKNASRNTQAGPVREKQTRVVKPKMIEVKTGLPAVVTIEAPEDDEEFV